MAAEDAALFLYDNATKENIANIKKIISKEFTKPSLFGEAEKKLTLDQSMKASLNVPPEMLNAVIKINAKYNSFYMNEWFITDTLATGLGIGKWKADKSGKDIIQWDMNKAKNVDAAKVLHTAKLLVNEFSPKVHGELNKKDIADIVDIINSELPKPSLFN